MSGGAPILVVGPVNILFSIIFNKFDWKDISQLKNAQNHICGLHVDTTNNETISIYTSVRTSNSFNGGKILHKAIASEFMYKPGVFQGVSQRLLVYTPPLGRLNNQNLVFEFNKEIQKITSQTTLGTIENVKKAITSIKFETLKKTNVNILLNESEKVRLLRNKIENMTYSIQETEFLSDLDKLIIAPESFGEKPTPYSLIQLKMLEKIFKSKSILEIIDIAKKKQDQILVEKTQSDYENVLPIDEASPNNSDF